MRSLSGRNDSAVEVPTWSRAVAIEAALVYPIAPFVIPTVPRTSNKFQKLVLGKVALRHLLGRKGFP
jgi:hypothetical protein